ncbi:hypothetical protein NF212_10075 [Parasalinivibrio latis]|uniref:hypothetical protein n=1 Tax=Parasalinivibrio latis TaxID=2952610 RepID=UPI0030E350AB
MDIRFLHTSAANKQLFKALAATTLPTHSLTHLVREDFLQRAQQLENLDSLEDDIKSFILGQLADGADLIACTCSTIGKSAESASPNVIRVDRPMAEQAVRFNRVLVVMALESTAVPTADLLHEEAGKAGTEPNLEFLMVENAWQHFMNGKTDAYCNAVAEAVNSHEGNSDAIVLAQASMYGATGKIDKEIPVLNSPDTFITFLSGQAFIQN